MFLKTKCTCALWNYEACSEIIETVAFYHEHIDVGKLNSARIIIDIL